MLRRWFTPIVWVGIAACAGTRRPAPASPPAVPEPSRSQSRGVEPAPSTPGPRAAPTSRPAIAPQLAYLAGLMPLKTTGVESFRIAHPTFDGRGVLIGILDGGVDPGVPGMARTSTDQRKLLDLRDFSGEGRIALAPAEVDANGQVTVAGMVVTGVGRLTRLAPRPYYAGVFRERALGSGVTADVNGDGDDEDVFPVILGEASDGWVVMTDTDGDGSLEDERALRDYAVAAETFAYGSGPMTLAVNLQERDQKPILDFYFDNSSHGTHVAGIAAGHDLFGVPGFDGVAPGAQVLALKIAHNARGKISVTGSMVRALRHAAEFAARRNLPLVLNLSYGVGNEQEGAATIDSVVTRFALERPEIVIVVSAGNDGPGLSTLHFPASADLALAVCALFPAEFVRPPEPGVPRAPDLLGWWSARGGEVAKPDLCAPGVAFSNVPPGRTGEEISAGTSMAAPHVAGVAALLVSAMTQEGRRVRAVDLRRALVATARRLSAATRIDAGAGVPDVAAAYAWLHASHQAGVYVVRSLLDGGNTSRSSGAYRRAGLASPADTVQRFLVTPLAGQAAARLTLTPDVEWLRAPPMVELAGAPATVTVTYDAARLREAGLHVGTVWARQASDTLAGPAFALTNTVVVPHRLEQPFVDRRTLNAGAFARYFVAVPPDAGGLEASLELLGSGKATLYVFEPTGQPHRGGSRIEVGDTEGARGAITVRAEDLVPGVYEAVVVAPPGGPARYEIRTALPAVIVEDVDPTPAVRLRNRTGADVEAAVEAHVIGAVRSVQVVGSGPAPEVLRVPVPAWADRLAVDVRLPSELWHAVTDFGVTLYDSAGRRVSEGPLNYAFGRHEIRIDSRAVGREVQVELLPAFAREEALPRWEAAVTVRLLAKEPQALAFVDARSHGTRVQVGSQESLRVPFAPAPPDTTLPVAFRPLLEVVARTAGGAPSGLTVPWPVP